MILKKRKIKYAARRPVLTVVFFLCWFALLAFLIDGVMKFQTLVDFFGSYILVEIALLLLVILPTWTVYKSRWYFQGACRRKSRHICHFNLFQPYEKHHSTMLDAARLAEELGVKHLILYHTEDRTLETRKERYTAEAQKEYSGQVWVPDDLERIML